MLEQPTPILPIPEAPGGELNAEISATIVLNDRLPRHQKLRESVRPWR